MKPAPNNREAEQAKYASEMDIGSEPLQSFSRFPDLPPDVRFRIWGYALGEKQWLVPKLVEPAAKGSCIMFHTPPAFLVCPDLRQEAIRCYEISTWQRFAFPQGLSATPEAIAKIWEELTRVYAKYKVTPDIINPYWYCLRAAKKQILSTPDLQSGALEFREKMQRSEVWERIDVRTLNDEKLICDIVAASVFLRGRREIELANPSYVVQRTRPDGILEEVREVNPFLYGNTDDV